MVLTYNNQYLFAIGSLGRLQQIDITQKKVIREFGNVPGLFRSMAITRDDSTLFMGSMMGDLVEFNYKSKK